MKFNTFLDIVFIYVFITLGNAILYRTGTNVAKTIAHRFGYLSIDECVVLKNESEK